MASNFGIWRSHMGRGWCGAICKATFGGDRLGDGTGIMSFDLGVLGLMSLRYGCKDNRDHKLPSLS